MQMRAIGTCSYIAECSLSSAKLRKKYGKRKPLYYNKVYFFFYKVTLLLLYSVIFSFCLHPFSPPILSL